MGKIVNYKCHNCEFKVDTWIGVGFASFDNTKTINKIKNGDYGQLLKKGYTENKDNVEVINEYKMFQCPICETLEVYEQIRVMTKDNEFKSSHLCSNCQNESVEIEEDEEIKCPKCHRYTIYKEERGDWD